MITIDGQLYYTKEETIAIAEETAHRCLTLLEDRYKDQMKDLVKDAIDFATNETLKMIRWRF